MKRNVRRVADHWHEACYSRSMRFRLWYSGLAALTVFALSVSSWAGVPASDPTAVGYDDTSSSVARTPLRNDWILSLEAAMQTPVDLGGRIGVELPFGVRAFGGYGWVPPFYMDVFTGMAARASSDARLRALMDEADYSGHTWRLGLGVRPFPKLGLYLDAAYVRAALDASLDLKGTEVPELAEMVGGYALRTELDLWLVELGYQVEMRDRLLLAAGIGLLGTWNATTWLKPNGGAPSGEVLSEAAAQVDSAFEKYGFIPTLNLRAGVDLL